MWVYFRTLFHSVSLAHHMWLAIYSDNLDFTKVEDPRFQDMRRYAPCTLTGWNMAFQMIFLVLAVKQDATEWSDRAGDGGCGGVGGGGGGGHVMTRTIYWRDVTFSGLVVPYTMFVSAMFWSLYALDRELVYPRVYDAAVPTWFNHAVHSSVLLVAALELALQPRRPPAPEQRAAHRALYWSINILYAAVFYTTYFLNGKWVYPVFYLLSWWQVCLFQLGIWILLHLFYELQWPLVRWLHGQPVDSGYLDERPEHKCNSIPGKFVSN